MVFSHTATVVPDGRRSFASFTHPASVAVVGASQDHTKWGNWIARGALSGEHLRDVYLVNPKHATIEGRTTYPNVTALPNAPELVVIVLPGHLVMQTVAEALERGSRAFLVISARVPDEANLVAMLDAHGALMIGPNSLGIYTGASQLQLMWGDMTPGSLAIISQSGQLGNEIAALGRKVGVGVSQFVSLGNQVSVHAADLIYSLSTDPYTRTIALYLEDFSRGEEIFDAIRYAREYGKAVVLLTTGDSDASRDLAQSHTGAMTSTSELIDAACRVVGAVRVNTPNEIVGIAELVDKGAVCDGTRIAVVSDSGGQAGVAADEAARIGLHLPALSDKLRAALTALLPSGASTRNPIDLAGAGEVDMHLYADLMQLLATSGEVDGVILTGYFGSYGVDTPALLPREHEVAQRIMSMEGVPVLIHAMESGSEVSHALRRNGVPVEDRIEDLLSSVSGAFAATRYPRASVKYQAHPGISATEDQLRVREELVAAGIPFPDMRIVHTEEEVRTAVNELDGMLVLKAGWLLHKTEHDGVRLGIETVEDAVEAFREMYGRLGPGPYSLELQDLRDHVAEYIVGVRRDASLGTVITVGYGGTETELWSDISIELGPVSQSEAEAMVYSLKSAPLLREWRGREALDGGALAHIVSTMSLIIHASPAIVEIELNPVRVGVRGALAVDCLAVTTHPTD